MNVSLDIVVYTQEHCASCKHLEKFLEEEGFSFTLLDIGEDANALQEIASRGYMSTPIIRVGDTWIAGFNKKKLKQALASAYG